MQAAAPDAQKLFDCLKDVGCDKMPASMDQTFVDAGIDSFDIIKLGNKIDELYQVKIDTPEIYDLGNLAKLATFVAENMGKSKPPAAAPAAAAPGGMSTPSIPIPMPDISVEELFKKLDFKDVGDKYAEAFIDDGWDDVSIIKGLSDEELNTIALELGMKKGHAKKLVMWKNDKA